MKCEELRAYRDAYLDGELDLVRTMDAESHLESCSDCAKIMANQKSFKLVVQEKARYFHAPTSLRERIRAQVAIDSPNLITPAPVKISYWPKMTVAALILAAISMVFVLQWSGVNRTIAQDVVACHVRSLMASHLMDVASSDRHTVKPWFAGKLEFAPTVEDYASQGFPLTGGRLEYLNRQPAAALVYQHRSHTINLFEFPQAVPSSVSSEVLEFQGFHLVHWAQGGLEFWAVSDLNDGELSQFAALFGKK